MNREFRVEIIATGNEIIYGRIVDTNSSWIAQRTTEEGGLVTRIGAVGDSIQEIKTIVTEALTHTCDMIFISGGLGPTFDDITTEGVAQALGRKTELNQSSLKVLKEKYEAISRARRIPIELTPQRQKMARILQGSEPVPNEIGLAVGMTTTVGNKIIVVMPGVPAEMKNMFEKYVAPEIRSKSGRQTRVQSVRVSMPTYGQLSPIVEQIMKQHPHTLIKTYAADIHATQGMKVDLLATGKTDQACHEILKEMIKALENQISSIGGAVHHIK